MGRNVISLRALNRALLARQGLLEPRPWAPRAAAEAVGALQMQYWPSLGPALWSRTGRPPGEAYAAHETGDLLTGTLLRGTIHTVSAAEHPAYAAVTAASHALRYRTAKDGPEPDTGELLAELAEHLREPRTLAAIGAFLDERAARHGLTDTELTFQRTRKWRPLFSKLPLIRVPLDGRWSHRTPNAFRLAPPADSGTPPTADDRAEALDAVARRHLRAFGPAGAEDVAYWIAWNVGPVRAALEGMDDLVTFVDENGRRLYDLPDSPRPDPGTDAPVRLLPWFDSTLLAYAPRWRARLLPDEHKDDVFVMVNGRIRATFLVDGMVAGVWSATSTRSATTLTLTPLRPLPPASRKALLTEAERLATACWPAAGTHPVEFTE